MTFAEIRRPNLESEVLLRNIGELRDLVLDISASRAQQAEPLPAWIPAGVECLDVVKPRSRILAQFSEADRPGA